MNEEILENINVFDSIYPLTIVADRYSGVYSGGKYLAYNCLPNNVPKMVSATNFLCGMYWEEWREGLHRKTLVGIGYTVEDAVNDLYIKLMKEDLL